MGFLPIGWELINHRTCFLQFWWLSLRSEASAAGEGHVWGGRGSEGCLRGLVFLYVGALIPIGKASPSGSECPCVHSPVSSTGTQRLGPSTRLRGQKAPKAAVTASPSTLLASWHRRPLHLLFPGRFLVPRGTSCLSISALSCCFGIIRGLLESRLGSDQAKSLF